MNTPATLYVLLPSVAFRRAAWVVALDTLPAEAATRIWTRAAQIRSSLKRQPDRNSLGVTLLLRYMEWDFALYKSLLESGLESAEAGEMIRKINWNIFGPLTRATFTVSRLRSGDLLTRVRWMLVMMFRFVFSRPFEQRAYHPEPGVVAIDITVCPLAQFFRAQGASELTPYAACSLDFLMADQWGVLLTRQKTIAGGYTLCDFRYSAHRRRPSL